MYFLYFIPRIQSNACINGVVIQSSTVVAKVPPALENLLSEDTDETRMHRTLRETVATLGNFLSCCLHQENGSMRLDTVAVVRWKRVI